MPQKLKESEIKRKLKYLEKQGILYLEEKNNQITVYLENKGERKVAKYSLKLLLDFKKKNKTWNGKWFLIFFDVPEAQRNKRDYLRKFITDLGFYRYQQSVYLFPYECEKEITYIKKIVEGAKYISYVIADKIENEDEAKQYFNLQKR